MLLKGIEKMVQAYELELKELSDKVNSLQADKDMYFRWWQESCAKERDLHAQLDKFAAKGIL